MIVRTPRGRMTTTRAVEHLGIVVPPREGESNRELF
jgi:Holliday junction resolvasome RuvABC ATP-dependent DNA helicase subunit